MYVLTICLIFISQIRILKGIENLNINYGRLIKMITKKQAKNYLELFEYPTARTIKAFAIIYPNIFNNILRDKQIKKIIGSD